MTWNRSIFKHSRRSTSKLIFFVEHTLLNTLFSDFYSNELNEGQWKWWPWYLFRSCFCFYCCADFWLFLIVPFSGKCFAVFKTSLIGRCFTKDKWIGHSKIQEDLCILGKCFGCKCHFSFRGSYFSNCWTISCWSSTGFYFRGLWTEKYIIQNLVQAEGRQKARILLLVHHLWGRPMHHPLLCLPVYALKYN